MKKIIVLLCLVLAGCATVSHEKVLPQTAKAKPVTVVVDQKEIDNIIAVFTESIKHNPDQAGAYYNRGSAYFYKKDYDKSWQDIHKAEELGIHIDVKFIELVGKLKKASGRDR